jgi:hypothetical protein
METQLEATRLRMEVEARGTKPGHRLPVAVVVAIALLACGVAGLGVHAYRTGEARRDANAALGVAREQAAAEQARVQKARDERDEKRRRKEAAEARERAGRPRPAAEVFPADEPVFHPRQRPRVPAVSEPLVFCPEGKSICKPEEMVPRR